MARAVPAVPSVFDGQAITAGIWDSFAYANAFHTGPPMALMWQTVAQSIPSTTATWINFDQVLRDQDAGHNTSVNPNRYTVQVPGLYHVSVGATLNATSNAGGERSVCIIVNGTTIWAIHLLAPIASGLVSFGGNPVGYAGGCEFDIPLNTGDYVTAQLWQDSGAAISTMVGGQSNSFMHIRWVAQ